MREWINIITESSTPVTLTERTHSMRTGMGIEVVAIENPMPQQLQVWLDKFHDLRGLIDDEGKIFVWSAMDMTHFHAEMQLGVKIDIGFYLRERLDGRLAVRWEDYSGEGNNPEKFPTFQRMTRRHGVVVGKSEAVYENAEPEKTYTLYHGTCSDILCKTGWTPNSGSMGGNMGQTRYLYLSSFPEDAQWFANEKGCNTVLVVKNVPRSHLRVDPEDGTFDTVEEELDNKFGLAGKVVLTKPLPAEHFSVYSE